MDLTTRLARANGFPSFLAAAALVVFLLVYNTIGSWLLAFLRRLMCVLSCGKAFGTRRRLQRFNRPMFTAPFAMEMDQSAEKARAKRAKGADLQRARLGWMVTTHPTRPDVMVETKVWTTDGTVGGVRHKRGERQLTWQVIKDSSLPTYDILANPVYSIAVSAILSAAEKVSLSLGLSACLSCAVPSPPTTTLSPPPVRCHRPRRRKSRDPPVAHWRTPPGRSWRGST